MNWNTTAGGGLVCEGFEKEWYSRWLFDSVSWNVKTCDEEASSKTILVGARTEACFITCVICFCISILHDKKAVVFKSIITRPYAERQGFARFVIFHLMSICDTVNYGLILDEPSSETFDRQTVHKLDLSGTNCSIRVELSQNKYLGNPWVVLSDTLHNCQKKANSHSESQFDPNT